MRVSIHFAWYDLWVGAYWNRASKTLYVCPLPMFLIKIRFREPVLIASVDDLDETFGTPGKFVKPPVEIHEIDLSKYAPPNESFSLLSQDKRGMADQVARDISSVQPMPPRAFADALEALDKIGAQDVGTVDGKNIKHLTECEGCSECDRLMEYYTACDHCGKWGHKSTGLNLNEAERHAMVCQPCFDLFIAERKKGD